MNNRRMKNILILLLSLVLLCNGCAKEEGKNNGADKQSPVNDEDVAYEVTTKLTECAGSFYSYCVKEDKFYVIAHDVERDEGEKTIKILGIYMSNPDGSDIQKLAIPENSEVEVVSEYDFDDAQNFYYMCAYDEDGTERRELSKYGTDGKLVAKTGEDGSFDISDEDIIDRFSVTADGIVVLHSRENIYLLDDNLCLLESIKINEGEILDTTISKNGEVLCILEGSSNNDNLLVASLDMDSKKLGKASKASFSSEYISILQGVGNYDFYYTDESGIYGYDMKKQSGEKVFDYMLSDVTYEEIMPLSNGTFIGEIDSDEGNSMVAIYTKKNFSADCIMLTYATLNIDPDIENAIREFNNLHEDIQIVIKDYSSETDSVTKMNTDIIAGNIPDIFDLKELPVEQYAAKGLLEDLTPFFAKDEETHESDFMPSVLQAMKINDKIYYISPGFQVFSMAAKVSDVGTGTGWDYGDLEEMLSRKDKDARFFYLCNKKELLHMILWCQATDFVNQNTGECYFDSEDFKNLLKTCNERGVDEEDYEWSESEAILLRKGDILFRDASTDIGHFKETLAAFGEDVNFIGYPCSDKQGNYIYFSSQIGISVKSEYKEEAWEFIRTLMLKDYQATRISLEYLPTREDCFQLRLEAEMATENYTNEMGREIYVQDYVSDIDGVEYEVKPLTKEQAEQYKNMITRAVKVADYDENIMEIVQEEAALYFAGERSLEDTVDVIQSRVSLYINESR